MNSGDPYNAPRHFLLWGSEWESRPKVKGLGGQLAGSLRGQDWAVPRNDVIYSAL